MIYLRGITIIVLFVVSILLFATAAKAAPATPEAEADYAAALVWWGQQPVQCASVTLSMAPTDPQGEGATARGTQPKPGASGLECTVEIYEDKWAEESTCMRGMVLRHEAGHNLGLGHDTDPASIMHPTISAEVWCGEYPPAATTTAPEPEETSAKPWPTPAQERAALRKELAHQQRRCHAMRQGSGRAGRCWDWARVLRSEFRAIAG